MQQIDTITVTIMSPLEVVFSKKARSLSSKNSDGTFDLLPDHTRFMTLIEDPIEVVLEDNSVETFSFTSAVLFLKTTSPKFLFIKRKVANVKTFLQFLCSRSTQVRQMCMILWLCNKHVAS